MKVVREWGGWLSVVVLLIGSPILEVLEFFLIFSILWMKQYISVEVSLVIR